MLAVLVYHFFATGKKLVYNVLACVFLAFGT